MTSVGIMYKIAGIIASAVTKTVGSVAGGTAAINAALAYKDYKERLYNELSGLTPEEASKIGLFQKLVRTPPRPGSKTPISVYNV